MYKQLFRHALMLVVISSFVLCKDPTFCERQTSCDSCIGVSGCTWCKELSFTEERCNTFLDHQNKKCPINHIVKAEPAKTNITKNDQITPKMRIRPQEVDVQLAVGQDMEPIRLSYNDKTDRALDLYYIMDLSATMKNDKITVSDQAERLVSELQRITKDVQLGFGSFIDKPVMPFVSASQLRPDKENNLDIPYGFRNWLKLTHEWASFRTIVSRAKISWNLDEPEGTLDALMQAITCTDEIGWRNHSRKLIVVATDGPFHIAGDGKLGGIVRPNDMKCHMKNNMYTHSTLLDYPSIDELNAVILQHKVYVIFAVSKGEQDADVFKVYDQLQKHISQSTVAELTRNSSNVVHIIKKKYQEISGKVEILIEEKPDNVEVAVMAKCSSNSNIFVPQMFCTDVGVGSQIDFQIYLKLKKCPDRKTEFQKNGQKDKVVVSFFESTPTEKLVINLSYACTCKSCNKERNTDPNDLNLYCSGAQFSEYISCGACKCKSSRSGNACQCSDDNENEPANSKTCVNPKESQNSYGRNITCSDRGECKCGKCACFSGYNGKFCEDSTKDCQSRNLQNQERLCSDKGQCVQGKCKCFDGYDGKFCECNEARKKLCMEPGISSPSICNGHGTCDCLQGQCSCSFGHKGVYCEVCKNCPTDQAKVGSRCQHEFLQKCIACKVKYRQKPTEERKQAECEEKCDWKKYKAQNTDIGSIDFVEFLTRSSLDELDAIECRLKLNESCYSVFKYAYQRASQEEPDVLKLFYTADGGTCEREPAFIIYIFGVILAVVLAGILALLIWKLATYCHDTREYRRFEKETKFARFAGGENPLYSKPMTEFQNPAYRD